MGHLPLGSYLLFSPSLSLDVLFSCGCGGRSLTCQPKDDLNLTAPNTFVRSVIELTLFVYAYVNHSAMLF